MFLILLSLSRTLSLTFMFLNHPLSLGFSFFSKLLLFLLPPNIDYLFSNILFLIMIGGMLVLFIYMTSVASNEKFKFSNKLFIFHMILILMISLLLFSDNFLYMMDTDNFDFFNQSNFMSMSNLSISKFFNYPHIFIMLMIIFYLLITLIAIVKITQSKMGPFRQMAP